MADDPRASAAARAAPPSPAAREAERVRTRDWLEALDDVAAHEGRAALQRLVHNLVRRSALYGVTAPITPAPYLNTIPTEDEPEYPGDLELEARIEALVRWNATAMVIRANRRGTGLGGHIATYASAATLFEVGFNHVFRGAEHSQGPDLVFYQGHASPGVYARAFLEGRLSEAQLDRFRREVGGDGLSSYPHPWLMPEFWEMPSVSMGLSPLMAIYAARFGRYLTARGLCEHAGRVWALLGDGEMDEPESIGALTLAAREQLGNLTFVVNCNLQRLDGPVRGNGRIVEELARLFEGAGWHVVKVLWGHAWEPLFAADTDGVLAQRLGETVDGTFQRLATLDGPQVRKTFFDDEPLRSIVRDVDDETLGRLFRDGRGGHDPRRVYAAYAAAEAD